MVKVSEQESLSVSTTNIHICPFSTSAVVNNDHTENAYQVELLRFIA